MLQFLVHCLRSGRPRRASAVLALGVLCFALAGCSALPTPSSSATLDPTVGVDLGFMSALTGVGLAQQAAIQDDNPYACVGAAVARGSIRLAWDVWQGIAAEVAAPDGSYQPPDLEVDASACLAIGLPSVDPPPGEASRVKVLVEVAGDAVDGVAALVCAGGDPNACTALRVVASVLDAASGTYSAALDAFAAESSQPDGVVTIALPAVTYPLS